MRKFFRITGGALCLMISLLFSSCTESKSQSVDLPSSKMSLIVNGERYDIDLNSLEAVNLVTLNTEFDAEFEVENATMFSDIDINGVPLNEGRADVRIDEISADKSININYTQNGKNGTITLNTLPAMLPKIEATGEAVIEGDFYLSFINYRLIMKYDNKGNIIFYRHEAYTPADMSEATGWWDFKKHEYNGKTYYSYHSNDTKYIDRAFAGFNPGARVILDERYNIIKRIYLEDSRDGHAKKGDPIDGHDFYFFSPDHYILSAYVDREVDGEILCVSYLQEVKDGVVVFDWWSTDHPEMKEWVDDNFDTSYDYVHFNSIQVLADGNWLCSFRHICSLVKIDRANGSGDIIWRIAGNALPEEQSFYGQHYANLEENSTITLFDNGNGHTPKATRILNLQIDETTGEVVGGGNILASDDGYFAAACGSAQHLKGGYIVGWGAPGQPLKENNRIVTELNEAGEEIFGLRHTGDFLPNLFAASYRSVKYR